MATDFENLRPSHAECVFLKSCLPGVFPYIIEQKWPQPKPNQESDGPIYNPGYAARSLMMAA